MHAYRDDVLQELVCHGIRPGPLTSPARVRELLNDLYCYELRRLRRRLVAHEFPRHTYSARVVEIRARYRLLSVPIESWAAPAPAAGVTTPAERD